MMPPKKSLAARTSTTSPVKNDDHVNGKDSEATVEKRKSEENMAPVPQRNIFTEKLVEGKRKRCIPVGQEMLNEWLTTNFEKSETDELSANDTYDHYVTACIAANNTVPVKFEQLKKTLSELFGVGFTVKDNSVYKGVIRKRRKKKKSDATKVQADTLKLKMKDILETTFTKLGNVKKGLRFRMILQSIAVNYPALRIELHPTMLKRALERGMYSGNVECLRGIGACGYYRLTTEDDDDDEEDDVEEKKESDADAGEENTEDGKESKSEDDKEVEPKKAKGPIDGSGDASDSGKTKQGKEKKSTKTSSKSKNKRKRAAAPKHKIVHGQPQRIEDCFPMAMTYMTEPKEASIGKIKKYLIQHYNVQREDKMKEATKYGIESGYWEQVTGTGFSGRLQLTVEKYNPGDDRDMCGKIMNAIVACTEPKSCSAMLLRKYIGAYHPQFNVLEKLNVFKHSLQRAIHKGIIRQLSGIGATGSFQLMVSFTPSPTILAGKDNEDDYASSDSEIMSKTINEVELYRDAYVPRPTKRRGHGRQTRASSTTKPVTPARNAPTIRREPPKNRSFQKALEPKKRGRTARSGNDLPKKSPKHAKPQRKGRSPSFSEDDVPAVKGKSPRRSQPQKRVRSPSSSEDDMPEVKGKSSRRSQQQKRARSPSSSEDDVPTVKGKSSRRSRPQKRAMSPSSSEDDVPTVKGKSSRRSQPQKRDRSLSSSEDDVPTVKIKSPRRSQPQKRARSPSSSEDDMPEVKGKSPRRSQPQKRAMSPSSSEDDVPAVKVKSPSHSQPQKRARSPSPSNSESSGPTEKRKSRPRRSSKKINVEYDSAEDNMSDAVESYTPRPTKSRSISRTPQSASPKKTPVSRALAKKNSSRSQQVTIDSSDEGMSDPPEMVMSAVQKNKPAAKKGSRKRVR